MFKLLLVLLLVFLFSLEGGLGGGAGSQSPVLSPRGPARGTRVPSLPPLLEGQPATQKGCVSVGVWEVFHGHQLVPAGHPHPTHTPSGHRAPLLAEHHPRGLPGVQPQVASANCCCRCRCCRRRWKDTGGSIRSESFILTSLSGFSFGVGCKW